MARGKHPGEAYWAPLMVPPKLSGQVLDHLLTALVGINVDYLRSHPGIPPLYQARCTSGSRKGQSIIYIRDPPGVEQWFSVPFVIAQGFADCKSLACWRAAELRLRGEMAHAISSGKIINGGILYHIRVQRGREGNFGIEDPSIALGMQP